MVDCSSQTDGYSDIGGQRNVGAVVLHAGMSLGPGSDDQDEGVQAVLFQVAIRGYVTLMKSKPPLLRN